MRTVKIRPFRYLIIIVTAGAFLRLWLCDEIVVFFQNIRSTPGSQHGFNVTSLNTSSLDLTLTPLSRPDVQTSTCWGAPILWEGTFEPTLFDHVHKMADSSVALTVFAVGKYLDVYLEKFLVSAEQHFMPGLAVTYFVFTERPEEVPKVRLGPLRHLRVLEVEKHLRWQDVSMMRMKTISDTIHNEMSRGFSHVFCFDVDQVFRGRWGSEALGQSVAQIHSGFYKTGEFTYDTNPLSAAYLPQGDFYYHAAVFGGSPRRVKELVDFCYRGIVQDKVNQVEALWHDESHLNKYFYLHKPSRLLSPEYCFGIYSRKAGPDVHVQRLVWAPKYYGKLRDHAHTPHLSLANHWPLWLLILTLWMPALLS